MLGDQADGLLRFGIDADNVERECALPVADQPARLDAAGGGDHIRLGQRGLNDRLIVLQREKRVAVYFRPIALRVNLEVAAEDAHRVSSNGPIEAIDQSIVEHHHGEGESHRQDNDDRATAVTPDVTPGKAQV